MVLRNRELHARNDERVLEKVFFTSDALPHTPAAGLE